MGLKNNNSIYYENIFDIDFKMRVEFVFIDILNKIKTNKYTLKYINNTNI